MSDALLKFLCDAISYSINRERFEEQERTFVQRFNQRMAGGEWWSGLTPKIRPLNPPIVNLLSHGIAPCDKNMGQKRRFSATNGAPSSNGKFSIRPAKSST